MRSQSTKHYVTVTIVLALIAFVVGSVSVSADLLPFGGSSMLVTRTWDGGGATNNWSDATNWSGDVVPGSGDDVVFDGTSAKNAVIDTSLSISSLQIATGYTGTVSQGGSDLSLSGGYLQTGGTFAGGTGVLSVGSNFSLSGGSFDPGAGTVAFNGAGFQNLIIPS